MRIIFLGTAATISSAKARLQSILFQLDDGELILFDTGEDVQRAFEDARIKMNKPLTIFITHLHGDHVIGLPGLLFRLGLLNRTKDVEIFGPHGLFFYLLAHRITVGLVTDYKIIVKEIDVTNKMLLEYPPMNRESSLEDLEKNTKKEMITDGLIKESKNYSVIALNADHTTNQSFSFIYKEHPRAGRFDPERAIALNIPRGHLWGKMQDGQTITMKDGRTIDPFKEGVVGPPRKGRSIILSGDTRPSIEISNYIKSNPIDVLIHEATYTDEFKAMAIERKHSTIGEACAIAK
nr:MBL fold metallo-hydrolase [Candidatus Sigynarchaeota archaeon]